MLVLDDIVVYGTKEEIEEEPPMVVIEIFDQDSVVSITVILLLAFHLLLYTYCI